MFFKKDKIRLYKNFPIDELLLIKTLYMDSLLAEIDGRLSYSSEKTIEVLSAINEELGLRNEKAFRDQSGSTGHFR